MGEKKSHLDSNWYVVGECVIATSEDPLLGAWVTDCSYMLDFEEWEPIAPEDIAQRIVNDHNKLLRLRPSMSRVQYHLSEMEKIDTRLYMKILETIGFVYHFNEVVKLAIMGQEYG